MLVSLGFKPAAEAPRDALQLLLDCHERIRRFSALALKVAEGHAAPPAELAEAASRVERYFSVAFPLHVADEDLSLTPRLRDAGLDSKLPALEEMTKHHREVEALLETLVPRWRLLREEPQRLAGISAELLRDSRALADHLEPHLLLEERELFPWARERLSPAALTELAAEFRARRGA